MTYGYRDLLCCIVDVIWLEKSSPQFNVKTPPTFQHQTLTISTNYQTNQTFQNYLSNESYKNSFQQLFKTISTFNLTNQALQSNLNN